MKRYAIENEVSKEPLHARQFSIGQVIDQIIAAHDISLDKFNIHIEDIEYTDDRPTYRLKMSFLKNSDVIIKAEELETSSEN